MSYIEISRRFFAKTKLAFLVEFYVNNRDDKKPDTIKLSQSAPDLGYVLGSHYHTLNPMSTIGSYY